MPSKMVAFADRILAGEIPLTDVPDDLRPSVEHIIKLPIYRLAVEVLDAPTKDQRNRNLERVPDLIRPMVRAEAERVFNYRRANGS